MGFRRFRKADGAMPASLPVGTNLLTKTEAFNDAAWSKFGVGSAGPVVTANSSTSPTGTSTAEKAAYPAVSAANNLSLLFQRPSVTAVPHTLSIYLRGLVGGEKVYLYFTDGSGTYGTATLCTLTTTWARYTNTYTPTAALWYVILGCDLRAGSGHSAIAAADMYVWGAQLEASATANGYSAVA